MLRSHRCSPGATALFDLWPFLQWTHRRHHGNHLPIQPTRGPLPSATVACSKLGHRFCPGSHAPDEDDPPARRCYRPDSLRRSSHLGSAMVLPTCTTVVFHDCPRERLSGQQRSATVSEVLGSTTPSGTCTRAEEGCGGQGDRTLQ